MLKPPRVSRLGPPPGIPHPGVCVRGQLDLCSRVARCMLVDKGSASSVSNRIKGKGSDRGHCGEDENGQALSKDVLLLSPQYSHNPLSQV